MLRRAQPLGRRFHESFITLRPSALLQRRAPFLASYCPACPLTRPHTLPRRRHYSKRAQHQKSGIGFWTVGIVAAVSIGGALFVAAIRSPQETDQDALKALLPARFAHQNKTDSDSDPDSYLTMAPTTLPGRPGNLTPEQENTLREFWAIFMRVFNGDIASEEENGAATNGHNEADAAAPADGKKDKKKSRLGMFKRNKGEQEEKPATASTSWSSFDVGKLKLAADDDKFGQTAAYKSALANIPPEELRRAFWGMVKHDHPDALLLRFLRARKWDIEKALIMAISAMQWRLKEVQVDEDIMKNGELGALETSMSDSKGKKDAEDFMTQMRMGKSFLHGLDVEGRPICYVRARLHKAGDQSEETIERFTVYTIETARMLLRAPVDTATVIFDLTDFSMANMDYTPVNFMIRCFEANYPESLGTVLVYRAPWIFNAIWAVVKGWLDPVVASKVHFPKNAQELSNFIPKSQIPTELGGDEKWEYKYVEPVPGENDKMKEEAPRKELQTERQCIIDKYETSIIDWVRAGESVSQDDRRKERDALAEQLRQNYWKLDPYVRARSLYDRTGVIKPGGVLDFYPEASH